MSSLKKKLTINATSAIVQVAFTALLYFFLYKYLLDTLGVKQLGVWSLILSFSSIANLANLGLTSGLVKFVAEYIAEKKDEKIGKLILTSVISLVILFCGLSIIILFCAQYVLGFVIEQQYLAIAFSILPLSLASLCVNAISGIFTSVLEGYQKNYLKNFIYIFSGIIMFVATILLTPTFHLKGVAIAQLLQAIFVLFSALILILRVSPFNGFKFWKWSTRSFKELFNYGYKFQVVSICQLLYEPTTKMLLSKYGGLALLGHYEMATRLVNQFRALLVNANQVVIPVVAEAAKTKSIAYRQEFYVKMNRIMSSLTFPLATLLIVFTPLVSLIWIGDINADFIFAMYVLTISSALNIMSGPAYFSCMGEGRLTIPVIVHVSMAIINLVLGFLLGQMFGGYGIILAWCIALALGSIFLVFGYNKAIKINFRSVFAKNERLILAISAILISVSVILYFIDFPFKNYYIITVLLFAIFIVSFIHAFRKNIEITDWLMSLHKKN